MSNEKFIDKFIIQLRHYREANQLSQTQMAELLKIGSRSYQRYENGESVPSIDFVYMTSKILHFKVSEIFSPEEIAAKMEGFRIYGQEEKKIFEELPLVKRSALIPWVYSDEASMIMKSGELSDLKKQKAFIESQYALSFSTPKATYLNRVAQEKCGFLIPHVATQAGHEDIKRTGIIWAALIERGECYFDHETCAVLPIGRTRIAGNFVFRNYERSYYIFGVFDLATPIQEKE